VRGALFLRRAGTNVAEHRHRFTAAMRIRQPARFKAAYADGTSVTRGPLKVFALSNDLSHPRLGISIGRRVGTAPRRNRIKRMLREAFRLMQHDWPAGYDLVIVVRPHEPMILADYQRVLGGAMVKLVKQRATSNEQRVEKDNP
jgi:ribonuclease P protein component